jgi:hypothetical protein
MSEHCEAVMSWNNAYRVRDHRGKHWATCIGSVKAAHQYRYHRKFDKRNDGVQKWLI